jgi:hypothetical protein
MFLDRGRKIDNSETVASIPEIQYAPSLIVNVIIIFYRSIHNLQGCWVLTTTHELLTWYQKSALCSAALSLNACDENDPH